MQKRKPIFLIGIILSVLAAAGVGFYFINRLHTNVEGIKADTVISAENLYDQYAINEPAADRKYLNKVIEVTGEVAASGNNNHHYFIILKTKARGGINCEMMMKDTTELLHVQKNMAMTIKGRCSGFLMDVNLVDCIISK